MMTSENTCNAALLRRLQSQDRKMDHAYPAIGKAWKAYKDAVAATPFEFPHGTDMEMFQQFAKQHAHVKSQIIGQMQNRTVVCTFHGYRGNGEDATWSAWWRFPKGTTEDTAREYLESVEGVDMDRYYSGPGGPFHGCVHFEVRPRTGELVAMQSGGLDI